MYLLLFDGGFRKVSEREPGRGSIGVVLRDPRDRAVPGGEISEEIERVPDQQSAEFRALIEGLHLARRKKISYVAVFSNSRTLVNQINERVGVGDEDQEDLCEEAIRELKRFEGWQISWIPQEWNEDAHGLASDALDARESGDSIT
jgi:ribonuclease HI